MFNVGLAGGRLCGRQLFAWLSLVVSFMASFVLSFFPLDVLDGTWDLIESVSEGFLSYSFFFRYSLQFTMQNREMCCLKSILIRKYQREVLCAKI